MDIDSLTQDIINDNLSGAQDLTSKAASLILRLVREKQSHAPEDLRRTVLKATGRLLRAHPVMASLFNLFTRILTQLDQVPCGPEAATEAQRAGESFLQEMKEHNRRISVHLFKLIKQKDTIVTHSASRSVREALLYCWKRGKRFSVLCGESRPACEGTHLACRLAQQGIPTYLTTDALALSLLTVPLDRGRKVAMVLVGADSISQGGLTNKAGTLALALVAKQCSIPFYALVGSEKFLPANFPTEWVIQDKPTEEILAHPPKNLEIINRYFDITPLACLTSVITEKGRISQQILKRELKKPLLHPDLKAVLRATNRQV